MAETGNKPYEATYYSKQGKAVVHIVAPLPLDEQELAQKRQQYELAAWAAWQSLSPEQQARINKTT